MVIARRGKAASSVNGGKAASFVTRGTAAPAGHRTAASPAAPRQPHPSEPSPQPATDLRQHRHDDGKPPSADKPASGRTTKLGRKTESPASIKTSGPSGQKGKAQHQKLHANK